MYKTSSINEVLKQEECPDKLVDMVLPSVLETDLFHGHTKIRTVSRPTTISDEEETTEDAPDQDHSSPESVVSSSRPGRHRDSHKETNDKNKSRSRPGRGDPDPGYPNSHHPNRDRSRPNKNWSTTSWRPDEQVEKEPTSYVDDGYGDVVKAKRPEHKEPRESDGPHKPALRPDEGHDFTDSSEHAADKRPGEWSPSDSHGNTAVKPFSHSDPDNDDRSEHKSRVPRRGDIGIQSLDEKSGWREKQVNFVS